LADATAGADLAGSAAKAALQIEYYTEQLKKRLDKAATQEDVDTLLKQAEVDATGLQEQLADDLAKIMKGAGIKIDTTDEFRKKSNAEMLAEGLETKIAEDINSVREKAVLFSDQRKAGIKKAAAKASKDKAEKIKKAAGNAKATIAKLKAKKRYYQGLI